MRSSLIEGAMGAGLRVSNAHATVEATEISQIAPFINGSYGDGVLAAYAGKDTIVELRGCRVSQAARASLASFGAHAVVETTSFECAPVHLNGERWANHAYSFENRGGNACGCGDEQSVCKVLSSSLTPPGPSSNTGLGFAPMPPDIFEEMGPTDP